MNLPPRECLQYNLIIDMLPLSVRNVIYAKSEHRAFKKGEYIYREGDVGPYFMGCLVSGRLRATVKSREGKEFLLAKIEKGEIFGEMSVFDQMPRPLDIIAEIDSSIMILLREDFLPHLLASPEAVMKLLTMNSRRMRAYLRRMELLALQTVKQKLGRHLIHSARDFGSEENGRIIINRPQNQADIGLLLGASRESISKQISDFVEQGLILYNGKGFTICDMEGLKGTIASDKN